MGSILGSPYLGNLPNGLYRDYSGLLWLAADRLPRDNVSFFFKLLTWKNHWTDDVRQVLPRAVAETAALFLEIGVLALIGMAASQF